MISMLIREKGRMQFANSYSYAGINRIRFKGFTCVSQALRPPLRMGWNLDEIEVNVNRFVARDILPDAGMAIRKQFSIGDFRLSMTRNAFDIFR